MAIIDIIKYDGTNTLVWKYPHKEFNNNSQLIVNESQEAVFISDGEIVGIYGPGKHPLATANLPFVKRLIKLGSGGKTVFNTELYFINRTEQMAIKWGTNSKIQYIDPEYGFPLEIGACGQMSIAVIDSVRLLIKLVGTGKSLTNDQLVEYVRSFVMNRIKSTLPTIIQKDKISIFMIDQSLQLLSEQCKNSIVEDLIDYGIKLKSFLITTVTKPDDDPNFIRFRDLHYKKYSDIAEAELQQKVSIIEQQTKAQQTVIEAEAIAKKRQLEGYTYAQEKGFAVAAKIAENEASGQLGNIGVGLGLMTGVGGQIGSHVGSVVGNSINAVNEENMFCPSCGNSVSVGDVFCRKCGKRLESKCVNCGQVLSYDSDFCPKCGTKR